MMRSRWRPARALTAAAIAAAVLAVPAVAFAASTADTPSPSKHKTANVITETSYVCNAEGWAVDANDYVILLPIYQANPDAACYLRSGNQGNGVRSLQNNLNACYQSGIRVDGIFGTNTASALRRAQGRMGVAADGIYGPNTASRMLNRHSGRPGCGVNAWQ